MELLERQDQPYSSHYGSTLGKFNQEYSAYLNHHFRLFRAMDTTVMLTITDAGHASDPEAAVGREQMLNFVQIEPSFPE